MRTPIVCLVVLALSTLATSRGAAAPAPPAWTPGASASPATAGPTDLWLPMGSQACRPIPDPPAPTTITCNSSSSTPAFCRGKAVDTICGSSGGYCLYCWAVTDHDQFNQATCACRNNIT